MPRWKVTFPQPVRYLAGHLRERDVTELVINAPTEQGALFHAIRVVQGDIGAPVVEPFVPAPVVPVVELNDGPTIEIRA